MHRGSRAHRLLLACLELEGAVSFLPNTPRSGAPSWVSLDQASLDRLAPSHSTGARPALKTLRICLSALVLVLWKGASRTNPEGQGPISPCTSNV